MSCKFCTPEYTHIDGSMTCERFLASYEGDALIAWEPDGMPLVCIVLWDGNTPIKARIPIDYCPFCGERL